MEKICRRIYEIGTVVGGGTPSTKNPDYWGGDIPWISPKDLTDYKSVYISKGENFLTEKGLKSGTRLLPKNTLLFSSRAPIGYVALAANPICTNQGFKSIVCDEKQVVPLYLYYYMKANLDYIKLFGTGATFPEISGKTMGKIKVEIFKSLDVQHRIASILSTYDTLIENNTKRIRLLRKWQRTYIKNGSSASASLDMRMWKWRMACLKGGNEVLCLMFVSLNEVRILHQVKCKREMYL